MKFIRATFLFLLLAASVASAGEPKTIIKDRAEADLLSGRHLFTQWSLSSNGFSGDYTEFSPITITEKNGVFSIDGEHTCYYRWPRYYYDAYGGYVKVHGVITEITSLTFKVKGTFSYFNGKGLDSEEHPKPKTWDIDRCDKKGEFTFSRQGHPKYWRLQDRREFCEMDFAPTADIFVAQLVGDAPRKYCTDKLEKVFDLPIP